MRYRILAAIVLSASIVEAAEVGTARDMYNRAMVQERTLRDEGTKPTAVQMRRVVAAYEALVRRHPASGYADNALWQAANLSALAYERFGEDTDKKAAVRLFTLLSRE